MRRVSGARRMIRGKLFCDLAVMRDLMQHLSSQLGGVETTLHDASATLHIEIRVNHQGLHDVFSMVSGERRCRGLGDGS